MNKGLMILKWTVMVILFVFVFGAVTMYLWNWLVPAIFNGREITFIQALGLLVLSKILFSGFGGKGGHRGGSWGGHWKQHYYNKWSKMTPEERERFKSKMREKWCYKDQSSEDTPTGQTNVGA